MGRAGRRIAGLSRPAGAVQHGCGCWPPRASAPGAERERPRRLALQSMSERITSDSLPRETFDTSGNSDDALHGAHSADVLSMGSSCLLNVPDGICTRYPVSAGSGRASHGEFRFSSLPPGQGRSRRRRPGTIHLRPQHSVLSAPIAPVEAGDTL